MKRRSVHRFAIAGLTAAVFALAFSGSSSSGLLNGELLDVEFLCTLPFLSHAPACAARSASSAVPYVRPAAPQSTPTDPGDTPTQLLPEMPSEQEVRPTPSDSPFPTVMPPPLPPVRTPVNPCETRGTSSVLVAPPAAGSPGNLNCIHATVPDISDDGRFVVFQEGGTYYGPGNPNNAKVFIRDRQSGITKKMGDGFYPAISGNGQVAAFRVPYIDTNISLYDRVTGQSETVEIDVSALGAEMAQNESDWHAGFAPALSTDGRYVAFMYGSRALLVYDRMTRKVSVARPPRNTALDAEQYSEYIGLGHGRNLFRNPRTGAFALSAYTISRDGTVYLVPGQAVYTVDGILQIIGFGRWVTAGNPRPLGPGQVFDLNVNGTVFLIQNGFAQPTVYLGGDEKQIACDTSPRLSGNGLFVACTRWADPGNRVIGNTDVYVVDVLTGRMEKINGQSSTEGTCGALPTGSVPFCGDGTCQTASENTQTCPSDCGAALWQRGP
jgi:hypothetical protein